MIYALVLAAMALAATVAAGYPTVALLRRQNVGKEISEWAPETHQSKAGTPTMGGLLIVLVIATFMLAANFFGRYSIGLPLLVGGSLALVGFVDDLGSLEGRRQAALQRRVKLLAFIAIGVGAAIGLYEFLELQTVNVPYEGRQDLGWIYVPIAIGVVVLTAGGVAVTDGLDGLAAGALALGGMLAVVAFMTGQWLILPLIGVVFVIEGASVGLQVAYFRLSGGKRIFRKTPIHHHFEEGGWSEVQTTIRFWVVGLLGALIGLALALEVY